MTGSRGLIKTLATSLLGSVAPALFAAAADEVPPPSQTYYARGTQQSFKGPAQFFTGDVQVDMVFPGNDVAVYSGAYVTFQPGARTAWHFHPAGQHMIIVSGTGLTGTRDGRIIAFHEGDTVWCPPDLDHWHGATRDRAMKHLVITGSKDGENVVWKEKVSDAIYQGQSHNGEGPSR